MTKLTLEQKNEKDKDVVRTAIAIIGLPWLAVFWQVGFRWQFFVTLLGWFFFYIPGFLFALYVIWTVDSKDFDEDYIKNRQQ